MPVYVHPSGGLVKLDQGVQAGQPHYVSPDGGLLRTLNAPVGSWSAEVVATGSVTYTDSDGLAPTAISTGVTVDTSRTVLIFDTLDADAATRLGRHMWKGKVASTTTISFERATSSFAEDCTIQWKLVEFSENISVETSETTFAWSDTAASITSDADNSILIGSIETAGTDAYQAAFSAQLNKPSGSEIEYDEQLSLSKTNVECYWQIVEFPKSFISVERGNSYSASSSDAFNISLSGTKDPSKTWVSVISDGAGFRFGDCIAAAAYIDPAQTDDLLVDCYVGGTAGAQFANWDVAEIDGISIENITTTPGTSTTSTVTLASGQTSANSFARPSRNSYVAHGWEGADLVAENPHDVRLTTDITTLNELTWARGAGADVGVDVQFQVVKLPAASSGFVDLDKLVKIIDDQFTGTISGLNGRTPDTVDNNNTWEDSTNSDKRYETTATGWVGSGTRHARIDAGTLDVVVRTTINSTSTANDGGILLWIDPSQSLETLVATNAAYLVFYDANASSRSVCLTRGDTADTIIAKSELPSSTFDQSQLELVVSIRKNGSGEPEFRAWVNGTQILWDATTTADSTDSYVFTDDVGGVDESTLVGIYTDDPVPEFDYFQVYTDKPGLQPHETLVIHDTFTTTWSTPGINGWTPDVVDNGNDWVGDTDFRRVTGTNEVNVTSTSVATIDADADEVTIEVGSIESAGTGSGQIGYIYLLRAGSALGRNSEDGYAVKFSPHVGSPNISIHRIVSSSMTSALTSAPYPVDPTTVVLGKFKATLKLNGSSDPQISAWVDDVPLLWEDASTTDSSDSYVWTDDDAAALTSGQFVGIAGGSSNWLFDDYKVWTDGAASAIEETLTLSQTLAAAFTADATAESALTVSQTTTIAIAADATAETAIGADQTAGLTLAGGLSSEHALSLDQTAGATLAADATAEGQLTADQTAGATLAADATAEGQLAADQTAGMTPTADATAEAALGADQTAGLTLASEVSGALESALSLGADADVTLAADATVEGAVTAAQAASAAITAAAEAFGAISAGQNAGLSIVSELIGDLEASVALAQDAGLTITTDATSEAALTLGSTVEITHVGNIDIDSAFSLSATADLAAQPALVIEGAVTLSQEAAAVFGADALAEAAVPFTAVADFGAVALLSADALMSLAADAAIQMVGQSSGDGTAVAVVSLEGQRNRTVNLQGQRNRTVNLVGRIRLST